MSNTANLRRFEQDLKRFDDHVKNRIKVFVKKISFDLFNAIVTKTPVDTGRAAASWAMSESVMGDYVHPPIVPGSELSREQAVEMALSHMVDINKPFGVWYIYDNVVYITFLENGTSKQAPMGMIRLSLAEIETEMAFLK